MGAIAFSKNPENSWVVAGWAFRQILDDTLSRYPEDAEMAKEFEVAKALSGLTIYSLRPELAARVARAIREVASGILSGAIRSGITEQLYGSEEIVNQYRIGLKQLLEAGGRVAQALT